MIFKKRSAAIVSILVLFCFFSMTVGDAWPLPETAEQDGIALIEKGEQKLSENLHLEALGLFNQAMSLVKEKDSRARIFLGLARVHFALGYKEKCSEFLRILLEIDPAMQLRRTEMPGDFAAFFDQELSLMQQQRLAEQKRLEEQKLAEQRKLQEQRLADELKKADELLAKEKEKAAAGKAEPQPQVQEKEKPLPVIKKKKKFPLLLVILSAGVVVVLIAMLGKKKKSEPQPPTPPPATTKYTLTVTVGAGASGTPASGTYTYDRGSPVAYSYALSSSKFTDLAVLLDGKAVKASGTITMDRNYNIVVSAKGKITSVKVQFNIRVEMGYPALSGDTIKIWVDSLLVFSKYFKGGRYEYKETVYFNKGIGKFKIKVSMHGSGYDEWSQFEGINGDLIVKSYTWSGADPGKPIITPVHFDAYLGVDPYEVFEFEVKQK